MAGDPSPFSEDSYSPDPEDLASPSRLTPELEDYLYVHGFVGQCRLGSLLVPPLNPLDPPGNTLDALVQYWLGLDRRRYSTLPFFVRRAKVQSAYNREKEALDQDLLPALPRSNGPALPPTEQDLADVLALFTLMDAYDRITGIQNRVRRLLRVESTRHLMGS